MLSANKANESDINEIFKWHFLCFVTIIQVKGISDHQVKKIKQKIRDLELRSGLCSTHFFQADSALTHMTIQVTQLRLNSNPKFANLT